MRVSIPDALENVLLDKYGHLVRDNEVHIFEYTEQDIYEQIRKLIQYKNS